MSESEQQTSSSSSDEDRESVFSEDNAVESVFLPYVDDPLADDEWSDGGESDDGDGLSPSTLERRHNGTDPIQIWCTCQCCATTHLDSALEFRCCKEVEPVLNLLSFEGRGDTQCITKHPDFEAMTNTTVLKHIAPLFRDKQGRRYRRQPGRSENELLRATAYRWLIRWICGHLGWENSRPLPACIYNNIRTNITSHNVTGYATSRERDN